jgi:hypothetical protein
LLHKESISNFGLLPFIFYLYTVSKLPTVLHKEIPFLRIIVPLCFGIISGMMFNPGLWFIIGLAILTLAGFLITLFFNKRISNYPFGIVTFAAFITIGLLLIKKEKDSISELRSDETTFLATLSDYPEEKEKTFLLTISLNYTISGGVKNCVTGSMVLYHRKD